jgi:putative FmdB family regulatory protein
MPIYAYRCTACGHAQDVLQKISDPVLTRCPACGAEAYAKQVTAAGFQLKGSGWYVTDFRGGNSGGAKKDEPAEASGDKASDKGADKPADGATGASAGADKAAGSKPAEAKASTSAAAAPAAPPPPASGG